MPVLLSWSLVFALLILAILLFLSLRLFRTTLREQAEVQTALIQLASKQTALLASRSPLEFQAIQAMEPSFQTSETTETERTVAEILEAYTRGEHVTEEEIARADAAQYS